MNDNNKIQIVQHYLQNLQKEICQRLEVIDGSKHFQEDCWKSNLGEGSTRILFAGDVFEQAGVNYSQVSAKKLPSSATLKRPDLIDCSFTAVGLSLVIHPNNPFVPTTHANWRFFFAEKTAMTPTWWFGGGYDLTPYYGFEEDCQHWHQTAKNACDPFGKDIYPRYKKWCDDYFYLKHRNEPRGIGGLFFDDLNAWEFAQCFDFVRSIGNSFLPAYEPIVIRRKAHPFNDQQRFFQCYRRGRYVEFNLLYDRGTLFGLQTGGRTESILMSLPPQVNWRYNWVPEANSPEAKLYNYFLQNREWVG